MRYVREVVLILGTVALCTYAGYGLALVSANPEGDGYGWAGVAALVGAALVTFVALVSSALATLVVRRRGWRIAYLVVTLLGAGYLALGAFAGERATAESLGELALVLAFALALWLPVGARWWLESVSHDETAPAAPPAPPAVSRRSAVVAGSACAAVVLLTVGLTVSLAPEPLPPGLTGFALVLVVAAALTSGRVPESMALALLAGVGVCVLLFGLTLRSDAGLVVGALAVVVLVAFSWRPFAVRLGAARTATTRLGVPRAAWPVEKDVDAPGDPTGTERTSTEPDGAHSDGADPSAPEKSRS